MSKKTNIAMWGPPKSGKTWLIDAFCRKVDLINKNLLEPAGHFHLSLLNGDDKVDVSKGPTEEGTQDIKAETYNFQRLTKVKGLRYEVSTHTHSIELIDAKGADTTTQTARDLQKTSGGNNNGGATSASSEKMRMEYVQGVIRDADCLVLLLEYQGGGVDGSSTKEFLDDLSTLRRNLHGKKRYIAACLPKADQFGSGLEKIDRVEPLRSAIAGKFQDEGKKVLEELDGMIKDGHEILLCAVSAAGYVKDIQKQKIIPNWGTNPDKNADWLLNLGDWNPQGVEVPFFWLFQQIELARLQQPHPSNNGWFQRVFGMYTNNRQENYIRYSDMLKMAQAKVRLDNATMNSTLSSRMQTFN